MGRLLHIVVLLFTLGRTLLCCFVCLQRATRWHNVRFEHAAKRPLAKLARNFVVILNRWHDAKKKCDLDVKFTLSLSAPRTSLVQEVLLQGKEGNYNSPVDIWSAGCIMAELLEMRPLFPGASQVDQAFKIVQVLGQPTSASWPTGYVSAANIKVPASQSTSLSSVVPRADMAQQSLLRSLLQWNPQTRPTAHQALMHECFNDVEDVANLDPKRRRSSISDNHLHDHHIQREISEEEAGRMVGATLLTTLKAVSIFKRNLRRVKSDPSSIGKEAMKGSEARRQTAPAVADDNDAMFFDMEAEMEAIAASMGTGGDDRGHEDEDIPFPSEPKLSKARRDAASDDEGTAELAAHDGNRAGTGSPSNLQMSIRGIRRQSAGSDAFDELLAEQEDLEDVDTSKNNNPKGGPKMTSTRPRRVSSMPPSVAAIEEDSENVAHIPIRELSATNLANHDEQFEREQRATLVPAATPTTPTVPSLPDGSVGRSADSQAYDHRPAPLDAVGEDIIVRRSLSRQQSRGAESTSSWADSEIASRPSSSQSSRQGHSRPGTGTLSMPGTPLSPMTPLSSTFGGAGGVGMGSPPSLALSPLPSNVAWDPLGDATRQIQIDWTASRWGGVETPTIPAMSNEQLEARKRIYKHTLRKFEVRFAEINGHAPGKEEKRPLKTIYRMHKSLRAEIEARAVSSSN